nr:MAG TPA: hypothetical protein [Caudoviricetes sp.]
MVEVIEHILLPLDVQLRRSGEIVSGFTTVHGHTSFQCCA